MKPSTKNHFGFTLIEIIAVLVIMSIISAIVIHRVWRSTEINIIAQTDIIKAHLRYAQARAMNTEVIWGINMSGNTYSLFKNGSVADKVIIPGESSDIRSLPSGITVESAILSFDSWGIPHKDASATDGQELAAGDDEAQITVSCGGDVETIIITPNTGFIP